MRNGLEEIIRKNGREFFLEREGMHGRDARRILDGFKACAYSERKGVLCATMFGRFAEGADFPGEELVGIFLVGIPFDKLSVRTKLYLDYYKKLYGKTKGVYYGYIIPALRRASQALGRALRSKEDRAIFVCGDERYAEKRFFRLLPSFVKDGNKVVHYREISRYLPR
jgi:DNA excision repair protein ERCC-2